MRDNEQILLEGIYQTLLNEEMGFPQNWEKGFQYPYRIGADEVPFQKNNQWYVYIYNQEDGKKYYYSYGKDIFIPDTEFNNL
jgi:hypothetical protein